MDSKKNYYETLEVSRGAQEDKINGAYIGLVRKTCQEDEKAEEKKRELLEAYAVLSNFEGRKKYDEFLSQNGDTLVSTPFNDDELNSMKEEATKRIMALLGTNNREVYAAVGVAIDASVESSIDAKTKDDDGGEDITPPLTREDLKRRIRI